MINQIYIQTITNDNNSITNKICRNINIINIIKIKKKAM